MSIKRLIILLLVVGSGVAFYLFADLESMSSAVLSMSAETLLALVFLLVLNEIIKGFRWAFFLRASGLKIRTLDGVTSYLAAQSATALPGSSLLSARLAQEHGQIRMHQATASLVGQAIADAFALAILAAVAILITGQRYLQFGVPILAFVGALFVVTVIRNQGLALWVTSILARWRLTRKYLPKEEEFREHTVVLMNVRTLAFGACYSTGTTVMGASILLLIAGALTERGISPGEALYAHTLSTVARSIVPVPGGIGISDGSLAGLLNYIGIGLGRATFVALGYRSVTMFFRTILGVLVLFARYPHLIVGPLRMDLGQPARIRRRPTAAPGATAPAVPRVMGVTAAANPAGNPEEVNAPPRAATHTADPRPAHRASPDSSAE